jgi:iron complex transport system substrate-binding protein
MSGSVIRLAAVLAAAAFATACNPPVVPTDAATNAPAAARRIITLAPHLAELVYSAGAGDRLIGVVEYTDYPPAARRLPRVGDAFRVDYEAIADLHPDLLLAWGSGNPAPAIERLRSLGYRVVALEPVDLGDIAGHIVRIGELAGTRGQADAAAAAFRERLAALRQRGVDVPPVRVFVQLSERPFFTVTARHFLGQGLKLCGGENIFADLPGLTAVVSLEAVIDAAPEAIIASDMGNSAGDGSGQLGGWREWKRVPAVRDGRLFLLDADLLSRPSVRILDGIERLCGMLESTRQPISAAAR